MFSMMKSNSLCRPSSCAFPLGDGLLANSMRFYSENRRLLSPLRRSRNLWRKVLANEATQRGAIHATSLRVLVEWKCFVAKRQDSSYSCTLGRLLFRLKQNRAAFVIYRRQEHALALHASELRRLQIGNHHHLAPD